MGELLENIEWTGWLVATGEMVFKVGLILVAAYLLLKTSNNIIDHIVKEKSGEEPLNRIKKIHTFNALIKSLWRYLVIIVAGLFVLNQLQIDLTPILATAGIAGLAIGFGAQQLVRDIITGVFIIIEDHFSVDDYITTANFSGTVEELGLRVTKLRDFSGELHIIPNSSIGALTNHSRGRMRAAVEIGISYEEDINRVLHVLNDLSSQLGESIPEIEEGPLVLGVVKLGNSEALIRIIAFTEPMEQWHVEREILKAVKNRFDQEGIKLSHPGRVIYHKTGERENT